MKQASPLNADVNLPIALRMDDVGASTKRYEVYSKKLGGLGNWLFLKYLPALRAWGPYRELTAGEWDDILSCLVKHNGRMTVAVTAAWVERNGDCVPFPKKFPDEAARIKEGAEAGLLEIANHGMTHCVVGQHLPRLFSSNRKSHREFWEWLPDDLHVRHVRESQSILQDYFSVPITTFVPPGNVYTEVTMSVAEACGITVINCNNPRVPSKGNVCCIGNKQVVDFHDREIVLNGLGWFEQLLSGKTGNGLCFVRELRNDYAAT